MSRRARLRLFFPTAIVCAILLGVWSNTWIVTKLGLHVAPEHRRFVLVTAVSVFAVPYGLVYSREKQATAGLAAVVWSTLPLFSAIIAARLLADEPLTRPKLAGIAVGIAGLVTVFHVGSRAAAASWECLR